jgi:hypothetical protein
VRDPENAQRVRLARPVAEPPVELQRPAQKVLRPTEVRGHSLGDGQLHQRAGLAGPVAEVLVRVQGLLHDGGGPRVVRSA